MTGSTELLSACSKVAKIKDDGKLSWEFICTCTAFTVAYVALQLNSSVQFSFAGKSLRMVLIAVTATSAAASPPSTLPGLTTKWTINLAQWKSAVAVSYWRWMLLDLYFFMCWVACFKLTLYKTWYVTLISCDKSDFQKAEVGDGLCPCSHHQTTSLLTRWGVRTDHWRSSEMS